MEIILKRKFIIEAENLTTKAQKIVKEVIDILERAESLEASNLDVQPIENNYFRIVISKLQIGVFLEKNKLFFILLGPGDDLKKQTK